MADTIDDLDLTPPVDFADLATWLARNFKIVLDTQSAIVSVNSIFGRSGDVIALLADYNSFFLTQAEADALYAILGHNHTLSEITDSGTLAALNSVGTSQIDNNAVDLTKLLDIATSRILGRITGSTGNPEVLTAANVRSIINVENNAKDDQTANEIEAIVDHDNLQGFVGNEHINWTVDQGATNIHSGNYINTVYSHPNHSGDVTSSGDGAQTIVNNAVSLAKMADIATQRILGRITAATGDPEALTAANVRSIINVENGADVSPVESIFGRTGVITALQADYDGWFLTPAEGNAAYLGISAKAADSSLLNAAVESVSAGNNTIVKRHSSGYIYANYFNTTPNDVSSGVTKVLVETSNDGFMRHGSPAAVAAFIEANFGTIVASGDVTAYSDRRLKENLKIIPNALDKVEQLNGYTYNKIDDIAVRRTGVIAQEVLKVLPEAVSEDEDGMFAVSYGNMVGLLIEAIKELKQELREVKNGL